MTRTPESFRANAPAWLIEALESRLGFKKADWSGYGTADLFVPYEMAEGVFSCSPDGGEHLLFLDIDVPAALIPSSSVGHHHLVIKPPTPLEWEKVERVLDALVECEIVQHSYAHFSKKRKATALRLPWVRKKHEMGDAARPHVGSRLWSWLASQL